MSQETEPSLSEYARYHGLSIDHLECNPLLGLPEESDVHIHLADPEGVFKIDDSLEVDLKDVPLAGKDEVVLLASIIEPPCKTLAFDQDPGIDTHRFSNMKAELPMLRTDHEIDMLHFASPIVPDLAHEHLPLEVLDEEADEGLAWASRSLVLADEYMIKAKEEQVEVSKEDVKYMHEVMHWTSNQEEHPVFVAEHWIYKRHVPIEPLTPPLLPLSPTIRPYEPSSDTGHLETLSDSSRSTFKELTNIDGQIFKEDTITKNDDDLVAVAKTAEAMLLDYENVGAIYSPLKGIEEPPSSPPMRGLPHQDPRVEVPMTPPHSDQPPPWQRKNATFKDAIREIMTEMPPPLPNPEGSSSEDIDRFFASTIAPAAAQAERSIEQEQLQEADTTHRVAVPVMDFSLPIAPWKASPEGAAVGRNRSFKLSLSHLKESHFSKHSWPKAGSTDFSLQWMPFPAALGRVETYESITDDQLLNELLAQPEGVDSSTLTWKPEGLRIFDEIEDEEDEEIQEGSFPNERDIGSLLHKRKLELEQPNDSDTQDEVDSYVPLGKPVNHEAFRKIPRLSPGLTLSKAEMTTGQEPRVKHTEGAMEIFSAENSLDNFMSIRNRGAKKSELTARNYFPVKDNNSETIAGRIHEEPNVPTKSSEPTFSSAIPPIPTPEFNVPHEPTPFVVSTSFLLKRKLVQQVQRLYASAEFIERDFALHSAQNEMGIGKTDEPASKLSTMKDEADIILSPGTGLILTTLQKIKQRALPGQTSQSAIRERIRRVVVRYERLIVVVTSNTMEASQFDALNPGLELMNEKDCEALVEFNAFCLAVQENSHIIFTAEDVEILAKWVVALMVKHGHANGQIELLQEETLWEIFLRRAGMNAFAAQAILWELKEPNKDLTEGSRQTSRVRFGLDAFIRMSLQERIYRFERLLGGRALIERVSQVLDARW